MCKKIAEVKSTLWQKVYAAVMFAVLFACSVWFTLCVLFPGSFPSADDFASQTIYERGFWLMCAIGLGLLGFYILWSTAKYRSYMTEEGIGQTNGFRHRFVKWDEISGYTMELIPRRYEKLVEPVLRDSNARVVMRPLAPVVEHSSHGRELRAEFWQQVTNVVDSRRQSADLIHEVDAC